MTDSAGNYRLVGEICLFCPSQKSSAQRAAIIGLEMLVFLHYCEPMVDRSCNALLIHLSPADIMAVITHTS